MSNFQVVAILSSKLNAKKKPRFLCDVQVGMDAETLQKQWLPMSFFQDNIRRIKMLKLFLAQEENSLVKVESVNNEYKVRSVKEREHDSVYNFT